MATTMTVKGQVTVPKRVREALKLKPGNRVEFDVNGAGEFVLKKVDKKREKELTRFERLQGRAEVKWRTDELMALLRGD